MPNQCYPGAPGPMYLIEGGVIDPIGDLVTLHAGITEIRHLSPTSAAPLLPPDCAVLAMAIEMGSCLLVRRRESWEVWVAQLDRATHQPATVWHSAELAQTPKMTIGGERAAFQRAVIDAANAAETLDVRVWSAAAVDNDSVHTALGDALGSVTAASDSAGLRPRTHDLPALPPLPHHVPAILRSELTRVQTLLRGLHEATSAFTSGHTTAPIRRSSAVTEHIGVLSELQQAARAYLDALWTSAFGACRSRT